MLIVEALPEFGASTSSRQDDQEIAQDLKVSRNTVEVPRSGETSFRVQACYLAAGEAWKWSSGEGVQAANAAKSARY